MSKSVLYLFILVLLGVVAYLVWPDQTEAPSSDETNISDEAATGSAKSSGVTFTQDQTAETDQETVAVTGTLTGFVSIKESTGTTYTEATINDGTEILRVDLRELDINGAPEDVYADRINTTVTITGYVKQGTLVATDLY